MNRRLALVLVPVLAPVGIVACGSDRATPLLDAGSGEQDASGAAAVCFEPTDDNPNGLKDVRYLDSTETVYPDANWRVALEPDTLINWATFANAGLTDSAMLFDLTDLSVEMAGFLVSRQALGSSAEEELLSAQVAIASSLSGVSELNLRGSGSHIQSLDGFDTVVSTNFEVVTSSWIDATQVREVILPVLLGRPAAEVTFPDVGWAGRYDSHFVLTIQTLYRHDLQQTIYMGAIAPLSEYDSYGRDTGMHADDLAGGTGVTLSLNNESRECEDGFFDERAQADIIWVVDESGSMTFERDNVASNSTEFFGKALALGLDFRMAVTDMNKDSMGAFATRDPDGANERWILSDEADVFAAAVADPSGPADPDLQAENGLLQLKHAITRHLPRDADDPFRIRPDARLALMVLTDEKPEELENQDILPWNNVEPTPEQHAAMMVYLQPFLSLLAEESAVVHLISETLPFDESPCSGGEHAYGYYELTTATGGQTATICQQDLGSTLDSMLDVIVGEGSPIKLEYVPIAASITVMRDGVSLARSRKRGWDYRAASNSIVFYGIPVVPGQPAPVEVGYRRWTEQVVE